MSEHVRVEQRGAVLHLQFNRPAKKNALTAEMYEALTEPLVRAAADPAVRAVLFSGAGTDFTAGNDLADFLHRPPADEKSPVVRFLHALSRSTCPLVAAVQGVAVGLGTTMLLHCDLVYATPDARLMAPFVKLGLVPEAASSLLLPQRIGYARAAEMMLLGETMSGEEAYTAGLVNRLFDKDTLLDEAMARAEKLAAQPPEALAAARRLMRGDQAVVQQRLRDELHIFLERLHSDEAKAVLKGFVKQK